MRRWLRRIAIGGLCSILLLIAIGCIVGPDYVGQKSAGKYNPVADTSMQRPAPTAQTPVAEQQTEPHTCGLHATRSLYAAYGLDPDTFHLRFRLGADAKALRFDKTSTGTLHPDLYRVLQQDGFDVTRLDLENNNARDLLAQHLERDQLALALVYRGTYHWALVANHMHPAQLIVIDSLKAEPYTQEIQTFLADDALSITLIEPATHRNEAGSAHRQGVNEMLDVSRRK